MQSVFATSPAQARGPSGNAAFPVHIYSKAHVKQPLSKRPKIVFQD